MATAVDGTHPTGMHSCYNLFLKNYLMINYQATRNLLGYPDLQSWVPGWATAKKFLKFRTNTPPFHHLRHTRGLALHITLVIAYLCVCYIVTYLYNVL